MNRWIGKFLAAALLLSPSRGESEPVREGKRTYLDFKGVWYSEIIPAQHASGVYRNGETLITLAGVESFFILTKFAPDNAGFMRDSIYQFGPYEKVPFAKEVKQGYWQAVQPFYKDMLLFLNSTDMKMVAMETGSNQLVAERDIVLDLMIPAKDSRGEPIRRESVSFRRRFLKLVADKIGKVNLAGGFVEIPKAWREGEAGEFLMPLRLPGFELVTVHCDPTVYAQCQTVRGCYLHHDKDLFPEALTGIAVSHKRNRLLIGDVINHRILSFKYNTCYNVVQSEEIRLPKKLKQLTGIYVDDEDTLWVTTHLPDDYRNGSVFAWRSEEW